MTTSSERLGEFDDLEARIKTILPEEYRDCYSDVQPVSMGSASLKYGSDAKVAWDEIWGTFCDLAMAGGPPHKGTLLEPGRKEEMDIQVDRYREVVEEICRGVTMVTGLFARPSAVLGWIRVDCTSAVMAGWLARAIVIENVSAHFKGPTIFLPAGQDYRLEKEIKNVVTVIAKTCHYWFEHTSKDRYWAVATLFSKMESESPLIQPALLDDDFTGDGHQTLSTYIAESIYKATGLRPSNHGYFGWLGLDCHNIRAALWMMRVLLVNNLLSRREGTVVFVPVNSVSDPAGETVVGLVIKAHRFAIARNVFR
jgi:sirohydrochlorin cobaltochelatase